MSAAIEENGVISLREKESSDELVKSLFSLDIPKLLKDLLLPLNWRGAGPDPADRKLHSFPAA
jgi:hypothetical protein